MDGCYNRWLVFAAVPESILKASLPGNPIIRKHLYNCIWLIVLRLEQHAAARCEGPITAVAWYR